MIVSVDTRGFGVACELAHRGWKTVVIELSGSAFNSETEWGDRLGPFLSWEPENKSTAEPKASDAVKNYGALWLESGPVAFGGPRAASGAAHLKNRYGASIEEKKTRTFERGWPMALMRSVLSSRLALREKFLEPVDGKFQMPIDLKLPLGNVVKSKMNADAIAKSRRDQALAAGVRVLDAEQITDVRLSDGRVDRIEWRSKSGTAVERTRSVVWMLSEEESRRAEFVGPDVPLEALFETGSSEPLMAWWRNRIAVRGLKSSTSAVLNRGPETPPFLLLLKSIERPWSHDNLVALESVEPSKTMRVFDVWTRIPYWSRADHVYRDEQRLLIQRFLSDRFVGCELVWVSPSPLALTGSAIRLAHIVYSETSRPARARLGNICFAGPETWPGVGLRGLEPMEPLWIAQLEKIRLYWDSVARLKASRIERWKYSFHKITSRSGEKEV